MLLQGSSALAGLAMGCVAGFISQFFYLVLLFPIVMGGAIGALGTYAIKQGKVRSPWLALVAALVGGSCAVWGMHYMDYRAFRTAQLKDTTPEELAQIQQVARQFDTLKQNPPDDEDLRDFLDFLAKHPEVVQALKVETFSDYVDFSATQGVTITSSRGGGGKGMNLGYAGSYIYWAVELAIIAGLAVVIMRGAATEPFCLGCHEWKTWRMLGAVDMHTQAREALETGNLNHLLALNPVPYVGRYVISAGVCATCGIDSPLEVKLDELTVNENNQTTTTRLTMVTLPGDALPLLEQVFAQAAESESDQIADVMSQEDQANQDPGEERPRL